MAEFQFDFPNELMKQLNRLEKTDEIQERMLMESAPILEKAIKARLVIHKQTGDLIDSVKARKPSHTKYGWYVFVGPSGYSTEKMFFSQNKHGKKTYRKYKLPNAAKAVWLEYGTSHQAARPFLESATKDANNEVIEKLQQIFNEEVSK